MNKVSSLQKNGDRRLNVMFADLNYINRQTTNAQYIPLAIGLIAQYAKQQFGNEINLSLFRNIDKFLDCAAQTPPDIVGLSIYYWNTAQSQYLVNRLREMFGRKVIIVLGGPSIDVDKEEQYRFLSKVFPNADAIIANEGEISFSNIIAKAIANRKTVFKDPIDGASFLDGNRLVQGRPLGLTMDLTTMGSPYLSGLLDEFMDSDYQPLIQTSRFCPYTCAFCVSGKNRGKLRGYPIEQVKEELRYVSKKYVDRPHHTIYLADENFGILKRDVEIAKIIRKCNEDYNYPQSVFFYNDKRFTGTSRSVIEILGHLNQYGMCLALQTEDPNTLKAINRRNVTPEQIDDAMAWARERNITTTTELIFGMPFETKDSFVGILNRSLDRGFDKVIVNNLFIMDGIELNRPDTRKKYGIKTKYRQLGTNYGSHEDTFLGEYEEVVTSCNSFSYDDFLEIRNLNFMYYTVFSLNFQRWFFHFIRSSGIKLSEFFLSFINPDKTEEWPEEYLKFLDDLKHTIEGELHDKPGDVIKKAEKMYRDNNNDVGDPSRINVNMGARLIYQEDAWVKDVFLHHLEKISSTIMSDKDIELADSLIDLSHNERIDLKGISDKKPMNFSYDIIAWRKNKFKEPLHNLKMPKSKSINFLLDNDRKTQIDSFQKRFGESTDNDFYYAAVDFITPRSKLSHILSYGED